MELLGIFLEFSAVMTSENDNNWHTMNGETGGKNTKKTNKRKRG